MADTWSALPWLTATVCWLAAAGRLARWLAPHAGFAALVQHTLVLAWALLVVTCWTLSLLGWLTEGLLPAGLALGLIVLIIPRSPVPPPRLEVVPALLWAGVGLLWVGQVVVLGLLRFPTDWDSLNYHLPLIDQWLHASSLYAPNCMHWSNPGNATLLGLWLAAPFSGDFLVPLLNLPAVVLLAASGVSLCAALGLPRLWCHLTAFALVANFVVWNQLTTAENDVAVAALWCAALASTVRFAQTQQRAEVLFAALALGVLGGVKFYAAGYAVLGAGLLVGLVWWTCGLRAGLRTALLVGLALALLAGPWYLRNMVVAGSPTYPRGLTPESDVLTKLYPAVSSSSFVGNGRPELAGLTIEAVYRMAGWLHVAALLACPLSVPWLVWTGRRSLAVALVGAGVLWLVTPFAVEDVPGTLNQLRWHYCPVRYGLCFLSLCVVALAVVLADLSRLLGQWWAGWVLPTTFALVAAWQFLLPDPRLPRATVAALLVGVNLALVVGTLAILHMVQSSRTFWVVLGGVFACGFAVGCGQLSQHWHEQFANHYDSYFDTDVFSGLDQENAAGPVWVLDYRCYPFFGSARQHHVCQPVFTADEKTLLQFLCDNRVTLVAIPVPAVARSGWHTFDAAEASVPARPAVFISVTFNPGLRLHAVQRAPLEALLNAP